MATAKYEDCGRLGDALRGTKQTTASAVKSVRDVTSVRAKRAAPNETVSAVRRQRGPMWP